MKLVSGSNSFNQEPVLKEIRKIARGGPIEILDLGIGAGIFGQLLRKNFASSRIVGVEIWGKNENALWKNYDKVFIEDIRKFVKNSHKYDIILLMDVLEHLNNKEEGMTVLKSVIKIARKAVIISMPISSYPQPPCENPFEAHNYFFTEKELRGMGMKKIRSKFALISQFPFISRLGVFVLEKK
jgi:2-polyprenyl-3-methyl-5-hydroxy-6-metoxy-1,4-benzoquinol methylase